MKVLIGMENSGVMREAFLAMGHDVISVDLLPSDDDSPHHVQGRVAAEVLNFDPELAIILPPTRYMTNSGAKWLYHKGHSSNGPDPARWQAMTQQAYAFRKLWYLKVPKLVLKTPVLLGAATDIIYWPHQQSIQPYDFGDDASMEAWLWLKGVPPLKPTEFVEPRWVGGLPRWANQTDSGQNALTPSPDRWKIRAEAFPGVAKAMSFQWGGA